MIYARAYDQTVAEDYFAAMNRVEQRMEITQVVSETEYAVVKVPERIQVLTWVEQLAQPELCQEERLEIVDHLKQALTWSIASAFAPPVAVVTA